MRNPIVITSLEEDFRKIGLIKTPALTESTETVEVDEVDEVDEVEEIEEETDTGSLEELRIPKRLSSTGKVIRTKKSTSAEKRAAKQYHRAHRAEINRKARKKRTTSKGMRHAAFIAKKSLRLHGPKKPKKEGFDPAEALKSFANAAIIAEKLKEAFEAWVADGLCESAADANEFAGWAVRMEEIAEQFAEIATAIHESEEFDADDIEAITEAFNDGLDDVLDAVEMYEANESTDSLDEDVDEDADEGND